MMQIILVKFKKDWDIVMWEEKSPVGLIPTKDL